MPTTEKIRERIELLLRKAESTTPAEAEALTEAAEKLMLRYAIDAADLHNEGAEDCIVTRRFVSVGMYSSRVPRAAIQLAKALGLYGVYQSAKGEGAEFLGGKSKNGRPFTLVGPERDIDMIITLIRSILVQGISAANVWAAGDDDQADYRAYTRPDFVYSFAIAAAARITQNAKTIHEDTGSVTEVDLVDRRSRLTEWYRQQHGEVGHGRKIHYSRAAAREGFRAGMNTPTGETPIDATRELTP